MTAFDSSTITEQARERFLSYVKIDHETGAWLWTGGITGSGYGAFWFKGRTIQAHRFAWTAFKGSIPAGTCLCHRFENLGRHNVNPDHLFLGTMADNMQDAAAKGRDPRLAAPNVTDHDARHPISGPKVFARQIRAEDADGLACCQLCALTVFTSKSAPLCRGILHVVGHGPKKKVVWIYVVPPQILKAVTQACSGRDAAFECRPCKPVCLDCSAFEPKRSIS